MHAFEMKGAWGGGAARVYEAVVADGLWALYERLIDELAPRLAGATTVIDVGCGPGHATEILARRLPDACVLGVDLSETMVMRARQQRSARDNLRFEVGDAQALGHPEGSFDAALSVASVKHWPDPGKGASEMARVVRPGGWVGIIEGDPDCSRQAAASFAAMWRYPVPGRAWYFRRYVAGQGMRHAELRALLERAGLTELESFSLVDQPMAIAVGRKSG